ncbi:MAG: hypothetical protein KDD92_11260 [Caldilineaceae bacterium]|nr:hypothetical protein [Caldilineaceae bacterium]
MKNRSGLAVRDHTIWLPRLLLRGIGIALLCLVMGALFQPALAGWVPAYVTGRGQPAGVLLEWATLSEYNLWGFEIFCKLAGEPDDAYHSIATLPAVGGLDSGAAYSYLVDQGLEPGVAYCFRIQELTSAEEPPEFSDLCGYGLDMEPDNAPPAYNPDWPLTPPPVQQIGGTPTPIIINPVAGVVAPTIDPNAVLPTLTPTVTWTPTQPAAMTATPTATQIGESPPATPGAPPQADAPPAPPPIPDNPESPLDPPTADPGAAVPALTLTGIAVQDQASPLTQVTQAPVEAPPELPTEMVNEPVTDAGALVDNPVADSATGDGVAVAQAQGEGNPDYIVVTATPTGGSVDPNATFTPLPTAVLNSAPTRTDEPRTENILLMTLCFSALGVGGIGALGLTAMALYIRSRRET